MAPSMLQSAPPACAGQDLARSWRTKSKKTFPNTQHRIIARRHFAYTAVAAQRQHSAGTAIHAASTTQDGSAVEQLLATFPAHRRNILQGMLGTAAVTITSPVPDAAAYSATPPAADGTQGAQTLLADNTGSTSEQYTCTTGTHSSTIGNGTARGAAAARDPAINSGCATPAAVRQQQQLSGLVPPRQVNLEVEVMRAKAALDNCCTPLEKHRLLVTLKETNQAAFTALLQQDLEGLLPLVYTPTIGDACLNWGTLLPRPTGLYVSLADKGNLDQLLQHWPSDEVRLAVITDGERILGLGDLGAHGMGIPTGKCVVYSAAGAPPEWLLPITVDVGTNNVQLRQDPLYVGTPQPRIRGQSYTELMTEIVEALQRRFGRRVMVHWEDLAASNAFSMLQMAQQCGVPTFNDDIQATAAVAVAAVLGGVAVPGVLPLTQQRWLFYGAGQANLGTARLLLQALQHQGLSAAEAKSRIWMVDSKGIILSTRQMLTPEKAEFAQNPNSLPGGMAAAAVLGLAYETGSSSGDSRRSSSSSSERDEVQRLAAIVAAVQPTALIGAAAVAGAFGQPVIHAVSQCAQALGGASARPLVLALSNPTSKAECSFEQAMQWSGGRAVYASGSPFPPITTRPATVAAAAAVGMAAGSSSSSSSSLIESVTGSSTSSSSSTSTSTSTSSDDTVVLFRPGQANNCLVFPGLGLGVVSSGAAAVTDELLLVAAQAVAGMLTAEELRQECILPRIGRLREVTKAVAAAVSEAAESNGLLAWQPQQ